MLQKGRSGFTLIELLVVVAIIAVLAAVLFPVFSSAKTAARKTGCSCNVRQIGIGLAMYCDEWEGRFPGSSHGLSVEEGSWIYQLKPYLSNVDEVRICPSDPWKRERLEQKGTSYTMNEFIVVPADGEEQFLNRDLLPQPSATITTFTTSDERTNCRSVGKGWDNDHTHSRNWIRTPFNRNWSRILDDIKPDRHRQGLVTCGTDNRAEGSANYLYADTHVKSISAARVLAWAQDNVNFARPPEE
ncbi:MAG: prepilin-type N-terminal cleavage/methylation domain-containing protein [Fimbriimonadaceae bacterium]|nr:prepilin-type N-terminal cleavage/methylation domain-containing protein [Fimbriimonadaceae bacterium]QYK59717.1 MAG: prepilin-type N-terminal cleavage/methylation domain-containing protein [Fimbriimonadaceae bacterium]